jgi:hypothetical protein
MSVVDYNFSIVCCLTEFGGELCGLDHCSLWNLLPTWISDHNVRARIIGGVEPKIIWSSDAESKIIVVARSAAHENFVTIS